MKLSSFAKLLKRHYGKHDYLKKRCTRAAKKRRIQKKWLRKYGETINDMIFKDNPFLQNIPKYNSFKGGYLSIPFTTF